MSTWCKETPTVNGFYWYRAPVEPQLSGVDADFSHKEPVIIEIYYGHGFTAGYEPTYDLKKLQGEWQGPLTPTNQQEGAT